MAKYNISINSKFQPFSFDRYMQPIAIYANMYEKKMEQLQQQMLTRDLIASMVDPEVDKETYEGLQKYNDTLNRMADVMGTVGLRGAGTKDFLNLWHQYATDVAPVQNWVNRRNKDIEKQAAEYAQANGNIVFTKDARKASLDEYRSGKPLDYKSLNLNNLLTEISAGIQAISKRNIDNGFRPLGDYMESYKTQGYADLNELMAKSPDARDFINSTLERYGVNSNAYSDTDRARILGTVQEGANAGLFYDTNSSYVQNPRVMKELEYDIWERQQDWNKNNNPEWKKNQLEYDTAVAAAAGGGEDVEAERGYDFLKASGKLAEYTKTLDALTINKEGSLSAAYFGKSYVNPIKVYDEIEKEVKKYRNSTAMASVSGAKDGMPNTKLVQENIKKEAEVTANIMKKYGVTKVLTPQQYKSLKELGYSDKSSFNDFRNKLHSTINEKAVKSNHSSVNLPEEALDVASENLLSNLGIMNDQWHKGDNVAWEINSDGSLGKPIKYLGKKEFDPAKSKLKDVYYSIEHPDKLDIVVSNSSSTGTSKRMYVDPSVMGNSEITNAVNWGKELLALNDAQLIQALGTLYNVDTSNTTGIQARAFVQNQVVKNLRDIIRAYNKGRSKTDSKE